MALPVGMQAPMQALELAESQSEAHACIEALQPELSRLSSSSSSAEAAPLQVIIKSITRLVPRLADPEVSNTSEGGTSKVLCINMRYL